MKHLLVMIAICTCITLVAFTIRLAPENSTLVGATIRYIKNQAAVFAQTTSQLREQISKIKKNEPGALVNAKEALKRCRLQYKKIEFFMTYFFRNASLVYNEPNKYEVEEPFMEYREPAGLQLIETMLFADNVVSQKQNLLQQASLVTTAAADIHALLYNLNIDDEQILESIRLALIRVISLGITGFDAPELKTGIDESGQVIITIKEVLAPLLGKKNKEADSVSFYLNTALKLLVANRKFNSFNRLEFLTGAALPLQYHLGLLIKKEGLAFNTTGVLDYDAKNLFSADAINIQPMLITNAALVNLGEKLFFEKGLSGNSTRSCATCHQPEKYFTDGKPKSIALDGTSTVQRNAPTLFYVAYQYAQFWDGRAKSIDEQINTVLVNAIEMGADHKIVIRRLRDTKQYVDFFAKAFPNEADSTISIHNISLAIIAFLETLTPRNSAFDRYIQGDKTAMNQEEIKGFNLFMGKAQCGTCHFAPLFNGLIPPLYKRTELEILGITKNTDFSKPELDTDSGRFTTFPIIYYLGAFKTPTVRNVARTAPYMHNGAFPTLEKVLEFYNKGGGAGMGLNVPTQTLSPKPLKLDSAEVRDIISFLNSLTDTYPKTNAPVYAH